MTKDTLLKALSCDASPKDLSLVIKSEFGDNKDNCKKQILQAIMTACFKPCVFHFLLSKMKDIFETSTIESCDYISKLLFRSKADHKISCVKYLIENNKAYLSKGVDFKSDDDIPELEDKELSKDILEFIENLVNLDSYALRKALKIEFYNRKTLDVLKNKIIELVDGEVDDVVIEACFHFMETFPELANDFLFTFCYSIVKKDEDDNMDLKDLEKIEKKKTMLVSGGWTPPKTLMWVKTTTVFFEKGKEPVKDFNDSELNVSWKNMIKNAELCQDEKIDEQIPSFDSEKGKKTIQKSKDQSKKMFETKDYMTVWSMMSDEQKSVFKSQLPFKRAMVSLPDKRPTKDSKYSDLSEIFDRLESKSASKSTISKSKSVKGESLTDSIPEIDGDSLDYDILPEEFISGSSGVYAFMFVDDVDYIGKVISQPPKMHYHNFFNDMKKLFGLEASECYVFKIDGKYSLKLPEGVKKGNRVLRKEETEKQVWSVWHCYTETSVKKINSDIFCGQEDVLRKAVKLAIVRWLFGFGNTSYGNIFQKSSGELLSFWECKPDSRADNCLKGFMTNEKAIDSIKCVYEEIVKEIAEIFNENNKVILKGVEEAGSKQVVSGLRRKITSPYESEEKKSFTELVTEYITNELIEERQNLKKNEQKPKK